ncbi:MAG: PatB family C-S lyase [Candidatus Fermentibacteraceae bacterium]
MRYDFDIPVDRRNTSCLKWDYLDSMFGRDDLISMWIADMDFMLPEPILAAICERAGHGVFGYTAIPESFYVAVESWFAKHYGFELQREWIVTTPGVVPAFNFAMQQFTAEGEGVIIQPPVYYPFEESIRNNRRTTVENPLVLRSGRYGIDFDDLDRKAANARMLVICNPHNPVARVWSREELKGMMEIAERHDLTVFSDEIHSDVVFEPHRHFPTLLLGDDARKRTIAAYATSKSFNLAGLQLSVIIIVDPVLRAEYTRFIRNLHLIGSNIFGIVGTQTAYEHGGEWLSQLLPYLWANYLFVSEYARENLPGVRVLEPEGTFLLWLDCRGTGMSDEKLREFFIHKAGVGMNNGAMFGTGGDGFMRMNIATPRANLRAALDCIREALGGCDSKTEFCAAVNR